MDEVVGYSPANVPGFLLMGKQKRETLISDSVCLVHLCIDQL